MGRGVQILVAGLLVAAIGTALFTGAFFGSLHAPDKTHYQTIASDKSQADPSHRPRNGLPDVTGVDGLTERIIAKPQPRDPNERQDRDLAAQEAAAVFNYWTFWAVVAQTFLAGGALWMLIRDLQQNRRSAEAQLRAYLSVAGGVGIYQERGRNLRFEAKPEIINSGNTSAKAVAFRIKSAILPYPPPADLVFEKPPEVGVHGHIPAHQSRFMSAVVDDFIAEDDVPKVLFRVGLSLYVWGEVTYRDEFGGKRFTTFGQSMFWTFDKEGNPTVLFEYIPGMNYTD